MFSEPPQYEMILRATRTKCGNEWMYEAKRVIVRSMNELVYIKMITEQIALIILIVEQTLIY